MPTRSHFTLLLVVNARRPVADSTRSECRLSIVLIRSDLKPGELPLNRDRSIVKYFVEDFVYVTSGMSDPAAARPWTSSILRRTRAINQ